MTPAQLQTFKGRFTIAERVVQEEAVIISLLVRSYPRTVKVAHLVRLGYDRRLASDRLQSLVARGVAERLTPRRVLGQWRWIPDDGRNA